MKKTLVNLAISTALIAGAVSAHAATENPSHYSGDKTPQYVGLGVGAATGALVAGPVGMVIGGIVGSIAGRNSDPVPEPEMVVAADAPADGLTQETISTAEPDVLDPVDKPADANVVASAAPPASDLTGDDADHSAALRKILTADLSLDVYFRSGSTSVEAFYAPRMQAIAALMREMPTLELHIDGYSDRRGNPDDNLALSSQRLDAVREQLQLAGIDESRIHSMAHGEGHFVSRPGDLEAYTFDRRVVIRFEQAAPALKTPVASIADMPRL